MADLRLLDDYTKLPDGYTDYGTDKIFEKVCNETLESLANEMIKSRIVTMPKIYVVSSVPLNKESLLQGFTKMQPLLTKHEDCVIVYLGTYYKPLKRRIKKNDRQRFRTGH